MGSVQAPPQPWPTLWGGWTIDQASPQAVSGWGALLWRGCCRWGSPAGEAAPQGLTQHSQQPPGRPPAGGGCRLSQMDSVSLRKIFGLA